jgi:hypothetical protein
MMARLAPAQLSKVLDSVADATADVDWDDLESGLECEHERRLIGQLRILARITEVHRSLSEDEPSEPSSSPRRGVVLRFPN